MLDFRDSTCEPCLRALPALAALAAHDRLAILSITLEPPSDPLRAFTVAHDMRWIVATDTGDATTRSASPPTRPTSWSTPAGTIAGARCSLGEIEGQLAHDQRYSGLDGQR